MTMIKSNRAFILSGLIIAFFGGCLEGCQSLRIQEPQFIRMRNIQVPAIGIRKSQLTATLDYRNPNRFFLGLESLDLEVFVFENYLGHATLPRPIEIPARDTFEIPVVLDVDMRKLLPNAVEMGLRRDWDIRLEGKAGLRKGSVRLSMPIQYQTRYRVR